MDITFTGPKGLEPQEHIQQVKKALEPTVGLARLLGSNQINAMRERAFAGLDVNGGSYTPYNPAYARWKLKRGGSGIVNLFGVGGQEHMLDALMVSANGSNSSFSTTEDSDEPLTGDFGIGIYSSATLELRLKVHNEGRGNMPKRQVLGMSDDDLNSRSAEAGAYFESKLQRLA